MNSASKSMVVGRFVVAYVAMVVVQALLYSAIAFGGTIKPVQMFLVVISSLLISLFIELPVALLGTRFGYRRSVLALLVFVLIFVMFFALNVQAMAGSIELIVGASPLVVDGQVTGSGYWVATRDSAMTALMGMVGFAVFLSIAPLRSP